MVISKSILTWGVVVALAFGECLARGDGDDDQTLAEPQANPTPCTETCGAVQPVETKPKSLREGVDGRILAALDKLEELGNTIADLQADLSLEKLETLVDDRTTKDGQLYYQRKNDELRFRVSFHQTRYDQRTSKDVEDFVFADGWLTHRQERVKRQDRYQITRPGQPSIDLMRVGKSPLPIPIGQKTEEVLKNFKVSLISPEEKMDPAGKQTVHLKLIPTKDTELALSYARLEFWLTWPDGLPVRSQWENDSGDIFTCDMSNLHVNKELSDKTFQLLKAPADYQTEDHPLPEEPVKESKQ